MSEEPQECARLASPDTRPSAAMRFKNRVTQLRTIQECFVIGRNLSCLDLGSRIAWSPSGDRVARSPFNQCRNGLTYRETFRGTENSLGRMVSPSRRRTRKSSLSFEARFCALMPSPWSTPPACSLNNLCKNNISGCRSRASRFLILSKRWRQCNLLCDEGSSAGLFV